MAAGAVQPHLCVLAGQEGFHFRMLCFQHLGACPRLLPVLEAHFVIVGQDRFRRHLFLAGIGHHGFVLVRSKIVLDVALAAVQCFWIDGGNIFPQRLVHIAVGDDNLAVVSFVVPVAGIAGNRLRHLAHHFVKGEAVHAHALFVHHFGEVRRLAGDALGLIMGAGRLGYIFQCIRVAARGFVILGKSVSLIDIDQIRIHLKIVFSLAVLGVLPHRHRNAFQHGRQRFLHLVRHRLSADDAGQEQDSDDHRDQAQSDPGPLFSLEFIHALFLRSYIRPG